MEYLGKTNEYFKVTTLTNSNQQLLNNTPTGILLLLWFTTNDNKMLIDGIEHTFSKNQIICLTEFHKVKVIQISGARLLSFNKPFYCILDHDSEVGCKGILYYGSYSVPIINPSKTDVEALDIVWKMLSIEMVSKDSLQLEMLQMLLKRILILCTRLYKTQQKPPLSETKNDLIREFNYLVETHFKTKHSVSEYAELLYKSPKTISNTFKKANSKSPLQLIQERILLEARRLLVYSENTIAEVGYELGFNDVQTFSRFFKKLEGTSPTEFIQNTKSVL